MSDKFKVIHLSDDPEKVAYDLIEDSLPDVFLDQIDVSKEEGIARLMFALVSRMSQASLEKDEIVRFVAKNKAALKNGVVLRQTKIIADAYSSVDGGENFGPFYSYFLQHLEHALHGNPDKINIKSDRLLWLCYALGSQVHSGDCTFAKAKKILQKEEYLQRISPLSLAFMLHDYAEYYGTENEPNSEYLAIIAQCSVLISDTPSAAGCFALLSRLPIPNAKRDFFDLMQEVYNLLERSRRATANDRIFIQKLKARFVETKESDF